MSEWAIITGGANGIGASLAKIFIKMGLHVLIIDKDRKGLEILENNNPNLIKIFHMNLKDINEEKIDEIYKCIPQDDKVKYLVQNAAEAQPSLFGQVTRDLADLIFTVNVTAPYLLSQRFADKLHENNGRILHVCTGIEGTPAGGFGLYSLSKTALVQMWKQLKLDLEGKHVHVSCVNPGMTDTFSFRNGVGKAKELNLPFYKIVEKSFAEGRVPRSPDETASFLCFVLTGTDDEAFDNTYWNIYDKALEDKWKVN